MCGEELDCNPNILWSIDQKWNEVMEIENQMSTGNRVEKDSKERKKLWIINVS